MPTATSPPGMAQANSLSRRSALSDERKFAHSCNTNITMWGATGSRPYVGRSQKVNGAFCRDAYIPFKGSTIPRSYLGTAKPGIH